MQTLAVILAILKAVPILDKWFKDLVLIYTKQQVEAGNVSFEKALDAARVAGSTKALQKLIGSKLDD